MAPISWPDEVDDILTGDLTAAVSYLTPAGGAVVIGVAPCGLRSRDQGTIGFTTSLGFPRKLERIARDPRVALAYHAREHGFAAAPHFILAQGTATADVSPTPERLNAFLHQTQPYLGPIKQGPMWNRLLREYYYARVFLDVHVTRMSILTGDNSTATVAGEQWPGVPAPQPAPKNGTAPRVDMTATARRVDRLPHRLLAYRGHDGFPVILPIHLTGHDKSGLRLAPAHTALPPGARRAGLLAHAYQPHLIGLATRTLTGWLDVADDGTAVYAPHTTTGFTAPPHKTLLLIGNGLLAKYGTRRARQRDLHETLERLARAAQHSNKTQ